MLRNLETGRLEFGNGRNLDARGVANDPNISRTIVGTVFRTGKPSSRSGDTALAIELFRALRLWNLELIRSLSADARASQMVHPERGVESVDVVVSLMAAHDLGHLEHLAAVPRG